MRKDVVRQRQAEFRSKAERLYAMRDEFPDEQFIGAMWEMACQAYSDGWDDAAKEVVEATGQTL